MPKYPQIKFEKYHQMTFEEIDVLRKKLNSGEITLEVNESESMAYLNQMFPKYSGSRLANDTIKSRNVL